MLDIKKEIATLIAALPEMKDAGVDEEAVLVALEVPADPGNGDYAFPCFRLAKALKKAPALIAEASAAALAKSLSAASEGLVKKAVSAGPYINFYLSKDAFCRAVIREVIGAGETYGGTPLKTRGLRVVEYSSPNIAKPFHIGHLRSTVIGSAIANIMDFIGYEVVRVNHLGDYGTQFGKLIVAYRRFGSEDEVKEAPIETLLRYYTKFHELADESPELEEEARAAFGALERGEAEELKLWGWFREESLKEFTDVYDMLGIRFDSYAGESFYSDKMQRVIDVLEERGLLIESEGAKIVDLDEWNLGKPLIKKSDGSTLYITRDLAAAIYRKEHYGYEKNIYVVASQQDLHFKQMIKILELMGYEWAQDCVHVSFGLVHLEEGKMSTREGNVVFLADVLNEAIEKTDEIIKEKGVLTEDERETAQLIGVGAVVFRELHNNRLKDYVFTWDKVLAFDGETGPYVQYGYARTGSLLEKAGSAGVAAAEALYTAQGDSDGFLGGVSAFELAKLIAALPDVILTAADKYEPSIITRHVIDIAQAFSAFYHDEQILVEDKAERIAKLGLVLAARRAIKNSLTLLGVGTPEKM